MVFLDRDGTLLHDRPGFYLRRPDQLRFYRGAFQALRSLLRAGYRLVILTNQSGLAKGYLDTKALRAIHLKMVRALRARRIRLEGVYVCPHAPEDGCSCRKPRERLARRALRDHPALTLKGGWVVGDKRSDVDLARRLGLGSVFLRTGHGRSQARIHGRGLKPTHRAAGLPAAARWILRNAWAMMLLAVPLHATAPGGRSEASPRTSVPPSGAAPTTRLELSSETVREPADLIHLHEAFTSTQIAQVSWFPEHLEFEVHWGILSVGRATLSAREILNFGGLPAYHIVSEARSNKFCDAFYKVRDVNESWIDATQLHSLGYLKKLREGSYFRDEWVLYDTAAKKYLAKITNKDGSFQYSSGTLPSPVLDILSSIYYVRSQPLKIGDEYIVDVSTPENWPLVIKVLKKDRIKTPAGRFDCVVVEPFLRKEGIFIQKGKRLQVWITDDARRMPVRMRVEVFFGHVSAELARPAPDDPSP